MFDRLFRYDVLSVRTGVAIWQLNFLRSGSRVLCRAGGWPTILSNSLSSAKGPLSFSFILGISIFLLHLFS